MNSKICQICGRPRKQKIWEDLEICDSCYVVYSEYYGELFIGN